MLRNECSTCNPPETRKEADREGFAEKKDPARLYVGETASSIAERAAEHWRDAETGKKETSDELYGSWNPSVLI